MQQYVNVKKLIQVGKHLQRFQRESKLHQFQYMEEGVMSILFVLM